MKNLYSFLIVFLCVSSVIIAQPTLTSSNFNLSIGDNQLFYVADSNTTVDPTIGANVMFNYSGMQGYGVTETQYIVDPTTTTYTSDFPTANYADTTEGYPINKNYKKFELTDSLTNIGLVVDVTTYGTVVGKYNINPEIIMKYPFNYGDSYVDDYAGVFDVSGTTTNGYGTADVNADAWGTLNLPMGVVIDSVIRIRTVEHLETDSIIIPFPPITILPVIVDAEYINYYKPSISKFPLLSFVNGTYTQDNSTIASSKVVISQYPMFGVNVDELTSNLIDLNIYPNPTNTENVTLSIVLEKNSTLKIELINKLGQHVKTIFNGNGNIGNNNINISTTNLSAGVYFINTIINGNSVAKKLIVQ
jgi:hypothetical protein